ncbi:hypothetical protein [Nocardioides nitrophenolicus]|uniref:hypothetical protein n=1 Tax=Nocardioides nitrophenolicus TaxID=60489 RepID=UPI000A41824A|nr:hypothetical protein [Nocardioides nitrophenolicus]MBM7516087.1 hypothetical protein [Nocardioides nitrophenolicus]
MTTEEGTSSVDLGTRLILEAFRLYRVPVDRTRELRELRHDSDLLPRVRDQLDDLLRCIPADQHVEYDVQGLRDQGADIVVRLTANDRQSYVCLQVKSHKEIDEADLVAKLRTQHSESVDHYGPTALWCAVLAADVSVKNNKINSRLRSIRQAFTKKAKVVVIEPTNLGGFLRLSQTQMTSLVTLTMRSKDDPILADARADLRRHPMRSAILLELVATSVADRCRSQTADSLARSLWLESVSARTPWDPAYDGPELPAPPRNDDSPEHLPGLPIREFASEPEWSEVDIWDPEPDVLSWLLRARNTIHELRAAEALAARLRHALDSLVSSDDIELDCGGTITVSPGAHPALFAVATEAIVRYGLSVEGLREHLVDVLLPSNDGG